MDPTAQLNETMKAMSLMLRRMTEMMEKKGGDEAKETDEDEEKEEKGLERMNSKLKPKDFTGVEKISGKEEWDEWQWKMKFKVRSVNDEVGKRMTMAEKMTKEEWARGGGIMITKQDKARNSELYGVIVERCAENSDAMMIIRGAEERDGLAAWRQLYNSFNP